MAQTLEKFTDICNELLRKRGEHRWRMQRHMEDGCCGLRKEAKARGRRMRNSWVGRQFAWEWRLVELWGYNIRRDGAWANDMWVRRRGMGVTHQRCNGVGHGPAVCRHGIGALGLCTSDTVVDWWHGQSTAQCRVHTCVSRKDHMIVF